MPWCKWFSARREEVRGFLLTPNGIAKRTPKTMCSCWWDVPFYLFAGHSTGSHGSGTTGVVKCLVLPGLLPRRSRRDENVSWIRKVHVKPWTLRRCVPVNQEQSPKEDEIVWERPYELSSIVAGHGIYPSSKPISRHDELVFWCVKEYICW